MAAIEVRNLTKRFNGFAAVDNVTFSMPLEKPEILCLAGESGSGKTTIGRLILGFYKPTSGEILYKGKNIKNMNRREMRMYRREVQAVFQDPFASFNPLYTVDHALLTPILKFNLANSKEEARNLMFKSLESVGLDAESVLGKYPRELSGGQRQRIMLARALLIKPRLIIADEPVSMIDASLRADILNVMKDMKDKWNISFIYITHDLSTANYISDEIIVLFSGSIMEKGPIDKVIEEPLHPYVQLLISSIPIPNPKMRWTDKIELSKREVSSEAISIKGCKFYSRCPRRMKKCSEEKPALRDVGSGHCVACFLYQ